MNDDSAINVVAVDAQRPCHANHSNGVRMPGCDGVAGDSLRLAPITQAEAKRFIAKHHRHNNPSIGAVFVVGAKSGNRLVGVAMCGMPKARRLMDGLTLEVTRTCTTGERNVNSLLYGACARAAKALGYKRLVTYTLTSETGASLRAAGWVPDVEVRKHNPDWSRPSRKREGIRDLFGNLRMPDEPKVRWWKYL